MRDRGSEEARFSKLLKNDNPEAAIAFLQTSSLRRDEALALAAESCAEKVALRLLAEGADPNASLPSPLVRAIEARCHGILDALRIAGADLGSDPWWEDGDHPLTSAAVMADPVAMKWLCERGVVEIAAPEWLWEALSLVASSRKKGALEALRPFAERVLKRLQTGNLRPETGPLKKATDKLRRVAKKNPSAEALRSNLLEFMNQLEAEEDEVIELTGERRFDDLLSFIRKAEGGNRVRRAGVALLWGVRNSVWRIWGDSGFEKSKEGESYLEALLRLDLDVHVTDDMGRTALMYAARGASLNFVQRLAALGFDLEARDTDEGDSVLQWAECSAHPDNAVWVKKALTEKTNLETKLPIEG